MGVQHDITCKRFEPLVSSAPGWGKALAGLTMEPLGSRRVTVAGPATRLDISLPPQATLAELVPQLIRLSGGTGSPSLAPEGTGWTLARVDGRPLDEAATVSAAGILDGEVLYLHPAGAKPLPLLFDDIPAAVAHRTTTAPGRWTPTHARRTGLATAAVAGVGAMLALALGQPGSSAVPLAAGIAITLLLLATVIARGAGDRTAGAVCAACGLPLMVLSALKLGETIGPATTMMAVCAAAGIYSLLAGVLVPGNNVWPPGATLASAIGFTAALSTLAFGVPARSAAAVVVAAATLFLPLLPAIALRLGGVPAPRPIGDPRSLRTEEGQPSATEDEVGSGTDAAGRSLAGLLGGLAAVVGGAVAVLVRSNVDNAWAVGLAVAGGLALVLRGRVYVRAGQKLVLLGGGVAVLGIVGLWLTIAGGSTARLAVLAALLIAAVGSLIFAVRDQSVPFSPYLTRLVDLAEFAVLIALVPLAFAALELYSLARSVI